MFSGLSDFSDSKEMYTYTKIETIVLFYEVLAAKY